MNKILRATALLGVVAILSGLACTSKSDSGVSPELTKENRVLIQSITAATTDPVVSVDIDFVNLEPLSAIEVPLKVSGFGFSVDSVSFVDSRMKSASYLVGEPVGDGSTIIISAIHTTSSTPAGNGNLAKLYFSLQDASRGQLLEIDTTTIVDGPIFHSLVYADTSNPAIEIVPLVNSGEISVLY